VTSGTAVEIVIGRERNEMLNVNCCKCGALLDVHVKNLNNKFKCLEFYCLNCAKKEDLRIRRGKKGEK